MSDDTQTTLLAIYNRIAPQIKITGLTVTLDYSPDSSVSGLEITSTNGRLFILLSLYKSPDDNGGLDNYRWEYLDCVTGALIESELDYAAKDEEIIQFFQNTLETDDSVMKL